MDAQTTGGLNGYSYITQITYIVLRMRFYNLDDASRTCS